MYWLFSTEMFEPYKDIISFTLVHKKICDLDTWILHIETFCVAIYLNVLN